MIKRYKHLKNEIEKMWHIKTTIVPLIVSGLSMIKKGTDGHINKIPGSIRQYETRRIALCGNS